MINSTRLGALAILIPLLVTGAFGQKAPRAPRNPQPAQGQPAAAPAQPDGTPDQKPSPYKPYKEVITKDVTTEVGVFKVHKVDDHVLFEIPVDKLGREMLWQTEVAQLPQSTPGYPGTNLGTRIVRFTRRGTKVFLRSVDYSMRSASDGAAKIGVDENSLEPILMAFDVITENDDHSPVIDVTPLFTSDPPDFSAKDAVGGAGVDPSRSYIDAVKAFPNNIETRSMLTYIVGGMNPFLMPRGPGTSVATALVHYSLDLLPEKPMMGRLKDSRIGFFTSDFVEYGRPENRAVSREFIDRFRLEKKDPSAAVSEPIQPITFYLSREVPEKWRPYLKNAVEAWNVAFEQAGFKNAIRCIDAPTVAQDPDWDAEDARYSVIRWAPSTVENAMGPSIQDPRSGETLSAHIIVWNNVLQLAEDWYFSQCAAVDPQAQKLPLPDDLMGHLLQFIVTHEVGHTLGLEHNMKASSAYTVDQLRDPKFVEQNGLAASVMDYARFNYVAQPGDHAKTIGVLGPYDKFAIEYGYKPIVSAKTPDDEKPQLDALLAKQVDHPELRFEDMQFAGIDPTAQTEDLGSDALEASRLGLENIDRIAKNILLPASTKFGEDYDRLTEMQNALYEQRILELIHVVSLVGGVVQTDYHSGRGGDVFTPVDAGRQEKAVKFVLEKTLANPGPLFDPQIVNKITPEGTVDTVTAEARSMVALLLSEPRLRRMQDSEAQSGPTAYTVRRLVSDVSDSIWSDLNAPMPRIDLMRRNIQRGYLKTIDSKINSSTPSSTDFKVLEEENLHLVAKKIDAALPKTTDPMTVMHLTECRKDIEKILSNKYAVAQSGGPSLFEQLFGFAGIKTAQLQKDDDGCFNEAGRLPAWVKSELSNAR
jgi:hypothetical protein